MRRLHVQYDPSDFAFLPDEILPCPEGEPEFEGDEDPDFDEVEDPSDVFDTDDSNEDN